MAIFGYVGEFRGPDSLDALRAYGDRIAGVRLGNAPSHVSPDRQSACWGPILAREGPLTLVLTGAPRLAASGQMTAAAPGVGAAILARYRASGEHILRELSGPFSLAIVDHESGQALLAVDSMGIEALSYHVGTDGLVFSPAADQVAHAPEVGAVLQPQALFDYLFHHMIPAPRTAFQ